MKPEERTAMKLIQSSGGGAGGIVYWVKTDGTPGSQTLKKVDPTNPATVTTFDIADITEVYDAKTGQNLQVAEYPDQTHFIIFEDAGGDFFVFPYALWSPYP